MALTDWGRAISRCLLCQKKGVILGGGPVSPVHCSVKAEIPLVRRGPRQAGGAERHGRGLRIHRILSRGGSN